jgi:rhamnulokinase
MKSYLAIDIGASSGRHILGYIQNGKLITEEIYRFKNSADKKNGKLVWDIDSLTNNVIAGITECKKIGKIPVSIGIDTWGVDYALLDNKDKLIDEVFCYRDARTAESKTKVNSIISGGEQYNLTGIQPQVFNTVYQLYADKLSGKLDNAKTLLLLPDYLNFYLTGKKKNEFTHASTTGLLNAMTGKWDISLCKKLGFNKRILGKVYKTGVKVGRFTKYIKDKIGFDSNVILAGSHDTASAVMAVPNNEPTIYISSGTWSLMGTEIDKPILSQQAMEAGFTNEGGYGGRIRFLKNIMGLWMIQCVKKETSDKYSFSELMDMARSSSIDSVLNVNDSRFLSPDNMTEEIKNYCKQTNQKIPQSVGEIAYCIYNSLAICYAETSKQLENITGKTYNCINIVGGGCQNKLLNELTAKYTKKKVIAGPVEATAIGNILSQLIASGEINNLYEGRKLISNSFDITIL